MEVVEIDMRARGIDEVMVRDRVKICEQPTLLARDKAGGKEKTTESCIQNEIVRTKQKICTSINFYEKNNLCKINIVLSVYMCL